MLSPTILILAIIGITISLYITYKKIRDQPLFCVLSKDCNTVVNSSYSTLFFGIPNEIIGIVYYLLVISSITLPSYYPLFLSGISLLIISGCAAFFSLVLLYIQFHILKEWCDYCIASSFVNVLIFILEIALLF